MHGWLSIALTAICAEVLAAGIALKAQLRHVRLSKALVVHLSA